MSDDDLLAEYGITASGGASRSAVKAKTQTDPLFDEYGIVGDDSPYSGSSLTKSGEISDEWWKNQNSPGVVGSLKRIGVGAVRGVKDVIDTGAHGLGSAVEFIADKTLPSSLSKKIHKSVEDTRLSDLTARQDFDKEYPESGGLVPNATSVGRMGGQITATVPLMPARAFRGIAAGMNALPTALSTGGRASAPLLNRIAASSAQGALGGSLFNAATSSSNDKSLAENVGEGAVSGAIGGPLVTGAAGIGSKLASKIASSISPERAALAKLAEKHGIKLDAGQVSESPLWKKYNQVSGWLPFSGAAKASDKQFKQFSKSAISQAGEDAHALTPQLIQNAKSRIGNDYETVARNTTIKADPQLAHDLAKVYDEAGTVLGKDQMLRFDKIVKNQIFHKFQQNQGDLPGEAWQATRHVNSPFGKATNGSDTDLGFYLKNVKSAMDSAFNRHAPQDMQGLLRKANKQYKALKTLEPIANADPEGKIHPLKLMQKVMTSPGGKLKSNELGELADIGRAFFHQPSDSGTPLGEAVLDKIGRGSALPLTAGAASANALASGSFIAPTLEAAAGVAANRLLRSAVNSKPVRERMINAAGGANYGLLNTLADKAVPYTGANLGPLQSEKRQRRLIDMIER